MAYTFKDAHARHLDAGCRLPFADEVPAAGEEGPHPADRQAPGARTALGVKVRVDLARGSDWVWLGTASQVVGWIGTRGGFGSGGPGARSRLEVLVRHRVGTESTGYWASLASRNLPPLL